MHVKFKYLNLIRSRNLGLSSRFILLLSLQQLLMWLLLIVALWSCSTAYEILYAINCGGLDDIVSQPIVYSADKYYTEDTYTVHKNYIPRSIKDSVERMLIRNERTSKNSFSYLLPIKQQGRFGVLLRFYEYEFTDPGARVFNVKLGDQQLFSVDIIEEVGPKKPLAKFIEFQIRNKVVYLQTVPALNGFNFIDKVVDIKFQKVKGNPKVEVIMVVRGALDKFKKDYVQNQNTVQEQPAEYLCQKLHDATHNNVYLEEVNVDNAYPLYYLSKIFLTGPGILSVILFLIIVFKDWAFRELEVKIRRLELKYRGVLVKIKEKENAKISRSFLGLFELVLAFQPIILKFKEIGMALPVGAVEQLRPPPKQADYADFGE